jgi:thiol-disulfide isomerase/thioredoxin
MRLHRPPLLLVLLLAFAIVAAACGSSNGDSTAVGAGSGPRAGLDFSAPDLAGGEFAASSLDGRDAVLWFWAPWCTTCRSEAPGVVAAAEDYEGRVEVVGVAGRGQIPEMEAFVSDTGTEALTHLVDADGAIWSQFGVFAQPAFAFIDADGTVDVHVGTLGERALRERMGALAES